MIDSIENMSRQLVQRLNVSPHPVRDEQYVQASRSAIETGSIVGYRREDDGGPFTGWEIVATSEVPENARFGYYSVRELRALHSSWLIALQLPPDWAFRFDGNTLVDCVSDKGETIPLNIEVRTS